MISKSLTISTFSKPGQFGTILFYTISSSEHMIELCIILPLCHFLCKNIFFVITLKMFINTIILYRMTGKFAYRMHYVCIHDACVFKTFEIEWSLVTVKYIPVTAAWNQVNIESMPIKWLKKSKLKIYIIP